MKLICFVILHYKDIEMTDRCVRSVLRMERQECIRIVVVDNDIKEEAQKRRGLQEKYESVPTVDVIQVTENGGFSYANNAGYAYAKELGASFILVLNNDIEFVQKDFVRRLLAAYASHPCHILGPDIVRCGSGEHQNPLDTRLRTSAEASYTIRMNRAALRLYLLCYPLLYIRRRKAERQMTEARFADREYYKEVRTDIVPHGACLIFTPDFVSREAKAFEPETQFYYEEYILALRCKRKRYRIVYDPSLQLLHEGGKETKRGFGSERARLRFEMERMAESCEIYLNYLDSQNEQGTRIS